MIGVVVGGSVGVLWVGLGMGMGCVGGVGVVDFVVVKQLLYLDEITVVSRGYLGL